MQFLTISDSTTLAELSDRVGDRNVERMLAINGLTRTPRIGKQFRNNVNNIIQTNQSANWQRKSTVLNQFSSDSDIFETAALLDDNSWKVLSALETFPGMLKVPETVVLPSAVDILGNGQGVGSVIYNQVMQSLSTPPHTVDPSIFNEYSIRKGSQIVDYVDRNTDAMQWFNLPWGDITLYSSVANDSIDFPVYPEEYEDGVKANYTTMPDLLYQYEPWYLYQSSGPRTNSFTFHAHRDMWTGDHRDGKANELIRFCEAACYPEYNGSAVNSDTVTLYIKGSPLISGIMTDVSVKWMGPIGLDGWYLEFELTINITEISTTALNNTSVRQKPLIR